MVSLTLMLVIATITASIQQTLPATPYFKMIDIWLFFSMNLMVISLIFHTYLQFVVKKETKDNELELYVLLGTQKILLSEQQRNF